MENSISEKEQNVSVNVENIRVDPFRLNAVDFSYLTVGGYKIMREGQMSVMTAPPFNGYQRLKLAAKFAAALLGKANDPGVDVSFPDDAVINYLQFGGDFDNRMFFDWRMGPRFELYREHWLNTMDLTGDQILKTIYKLAPEKGVLFVDGINSVSDILLDGKKMMPVLDQLAGVCGADRHVCYMFRPSPVKDRGRLESGIENASHLKFIADIDAFHVQTHGMDIATFKIPIDPANGMFGNPQPTDIQF